MTKLFEQPYSYWVGLDTPSDASAEDLIAFNEFYDDIHVPEVLAANEGMVSAARFELVRPDARGDFGPRWLAVYELADEQAAREYVRRNGPGASDRPTYSAGPLLWSQMTARWRILWERIAEVGSLPEDDSELLFLVGMSVPDDTAPEQLEQFNDFYTSVHLVEVMKHGGFPRACRLALHEDLLHPSPGAPTFCAAYETGGPDPLDGLFGAPPGTFTDGPPAWTARDTRWRLLYRRLTTTVGVAR